ncbi:MAG: hypothetical protein H0V44_08710 [Planctomycetes bacterium]|nr:hypothetical protein [Planctomycetota bacterium]
MSDQTATVLVAAFFDGPGLLAVRFTRAGDLSPVARFATMRPPDASPIGCVGVAGIVGIGLGIALIAVPVVRSFQKSSQESQAGRIASESAQSLDRPVIDGRTATDCRQGTAWAGTLGTLADDLAPKREDLHRYAVRTLLDVPREIAASSDPTGGWLAPRCAPSDQTAYEHATRLSAMLTEIGCGPEVAVILDLAGPNAVAAAAAMSANFDPVFTMDNLPHPAAAVPSAQTLAAAVYWRPEFVAAQAKRTRSAPALFVLDGNRLAPYANEAGRFDNRSVARLPDAAGFQALGITRVLYVRARSGEVAESDDLHELFLALGAAGVEVRHLALESAVSGPATLAAEAAQNPQDKGRPGSSFPALWFWYLYGWNRPAGIGSSGIRDGDANYRATPRTTMFSGRPGPSGLDGGQRAHGTVIQGLAAPRVLPAPSPPSKTSGGSWFRSTGSRGYHSS